jgi:hypothetical protein
VLTGLPAGPGSSVFSPGVPTKTASQATCATWDPYENPDPPGCDWFTRPEANVNWVHGLGPEPQKMLPPRTYLGLYMVLLLLSFALPGYASNYAIGICGVCWVLLVFALRASEGRH